MATYRAEWPPNGRMVLKSPAPVTTAGATDDYSSSGLEQVSLASASTFPLTNAAIYQNGGTNDKPANAYDVRGCRGFSVQMSSFNLSGGATVQFQGSNDSLGYSPIFLYSPASGTFTSSFAIPAAGTPTSPNSTLLIFDKPWFQWLQMVVSSPDASTSATAYLSIIKRA